MEELSREYYAAHAGLKQGAELQQVYARHPAALGDEPLAMTREAFLGAPDGTDEQRQSRMLLDWQVEALASRALAPLEEREITWEGEAVVRLPDGRGIPFQKVSIEIANNADRAARLEMEQARAQLVERELHPMRQERFQRERDLTEKLQLADGYVPTWELLSGIGLRSLRDECAAFLRDTQAMWDDTLPRVLRKRLDIAAGDATRSDALSLFRARQFDDGFPARAMESSILGQVGEMGIDSLAEGRIRLDTGEREGKRARAFCAPVRVPEEVYLVLRPHGGQGDWTTFLHELGHALHFAYMRAELPFEYRWLGDNSVTEGYAMLFDHLMHDGGWVRRYTELSPTRLPEYHHSEGFSELHMLRRYCAKLVYEVAMYDGSVPWRSVPDLYVETLTAATTFRYSRADAFVDVDPRFYAARYLRAWQLQALLTETLRERFDEDWWRNPRCGPWMVAELFGEAQRELAHEQAARVTGKKLDFAPLVRSVERLLG
ncbi:MAG: hypothetical protein JWO05_1269 [Gemmatimonadetes bacterium]|nr:hypothetical protein [Gemmatimonadota bacterium]